MVALREDHAVRPGSGEIELIGLEKSYRSSAGTVRALAATDLTIHSGSFVSLVGPSGCGKSTLLKLVAGLIEPTQGAIRISGTPLKGPRRSTGIMFQSPVLFPWRTVLENVCLPLEIFDGKRNIDRARAREALALVGLEKFENAYPRELSGGMQQRVALSRTLVYARELLLLDEPFAALDEFTRQHLNQELLRLWELDQKTVLFVTHSIAEAVYLSDRIIVMGTTPGRVLDEFQVDLPRPRTHELTRTQEFTDLVYRINELLRQELGGKVAR